MSYKILSGVVWTCLSLFFGACQQAPRVVPVSYKQDFRMDTAIAVKTFPHGSDLAQPNSIWRIGDDRVLVSDGYDEMGIFSYPNWNFIHKIIMSHDYYSVITDSCFYHESGGNVDVFALRDDSICKVSSFFNEKAHIIIHAEELSPGVYIRSDNSKFSGMNEFHIIDTNRDTWVSKGNYPEGHNRFKRIRDFKRAYSHYVKVKPDKSAFAVIYETLSRLRIYDAKGDIRQDVFIEGLTGNYKVAPTRVEELRQIFPISAVTDKYIYLLNCTDKLWTNVAKTDILVLDWQGNLIAKYYPNVSVRDFFVDEERNAIYGTCWKKGEEYVLFTMDILHDNK